MDHHFPQRFNLLSERESSVGQYIVEEGRRQKGEDKTKQFSNYHLPFFIFH